MNILIIEDDTATAEFVAGAFKQVGYATMHVADGEAGLAAALHGPYDAAVVDIMLPRLDGLEIIRRVRAAGRALPIIVLSARGSVDAKIRGLEAGGDDYLAKPFSVAELVARVQALLRRASRAEEATILKVEDLVMDLVTHRVTRAGEPIDLQPLEYQLLEYLMRTRGRVVTRNTILDRVWNYSFDPHTNVVESRVYHLREKIDRRFERKLIRTVRGFGYVLG
ncbi:MAG: response regulator transcription factor [Kiritimatiellae bacterium]|nr:response regulator transcription factor [Kiritimatiellia bacterium]